MAWHAWWGDVTLMRREVAISLPATGDEEWQALREPLTTGWLTQGPKVAAFEKAFALRHGVRHALAASSCTTALHLILAALGIGPGDEVVVPAFTWVATANVVMHCGATPVFADIDPISYNVNPAQVAARLTPRTRAVIAVHLFGLAADMDAIAAAAPGIPLIEDAACSAGATYHGRHVGSLGRAAAFSFHPRKSITTGEGGMVTCDDAQLAALVDQLRNHGAGISEEQRHRGAQPYLLPDFNLLGYNYRMTDLQGAVGIVQLGKLDRFISERSRWAAWYREQLADLPWLGLPAEPADCRHGWQAFVCRVHPALAPAPRNQLMERLKQAGVATRPGTHAVHQLGLYRQRYNLKPEDFPEARDADAQTLAIPLHNRMDAADFAHVVAALHSL